MTFLLKYIRPLVLSFSALLTVGVYLVIRNENNFFRGELIHLGEWYGLAGLAFLYFTLLLSPLYQAFPSLPGRPVSMKALQSLGLSAFFFGALHGILFFYSLGGFRSLGYLPDKYLFSIILGFIALLILTALAITSFRPLAAALGKWWKVIHRLVYFAGLLILFHSFALGNHFSNFSNPIAVIFTIAIIGLFILQFWRFDRVMTAKFPGLPAYSIAVILSFLLLVTMYLLFTYGSFHSH